MAEAILQKMVEENNLENLINVESAGIYAMDGQSSSDLTVQVSKEDQLDLSEHRSQSLTPQIVQQSDLILVMTPDHKKDLLQFFPGQSSKIFTLKEFGLKREPSKPAVDDPIGMSLNFYRRIYREIFTELARIFPEIEKSAHEKTGSDSHEINPQH